MNCDNCGKYNNSGIGNIVLLNARCDKCNKFYYLCKDCWSDSRVEVHDNDFLLIGFCKVCNRDSKINKIISNGDL